MEAKEAVTYGCIKEQSLAVQRGSYILSYCLTAHCSELIIIRIHDTV
jgi:hypothetical protein